MKTENPTKYYSSKQENMIADYLGWSVVVASGARRFHPGDVQAERFLGECKTHTKPVDRIQIYKSVWKKISTEALSTFRKPVLFVDNGTQTIGNTWCVLPEMVPLGQIHPVLLSKNSKIYCSDTLISFNHQWMQVLLNDLDCTALNFKDETLLLMRLSTFQKLLEV